MAPPGIVQQTRNGQRKGPGNVKKGRMNHQGTSSMAFASAPLCSSSPTRSRSRARIAAKSWESRRVAYQASKRHTHPGDPSARANRFCRARYSARRCAIKSSESLASGFSWTVRLPLSSIAYIWRAWWYKGIGTRDYCVLQWFVGSLIYRYTAASTHCGASRRVLVVSRGTDRVFLIIVARSASTALGARSS